MFHEAELADAQFMRTIDKSYFGGFNGICAFCKFRFMGHSKTAERNQLNEATIYHKRSANSAP